MRAATVSCDTRGGPVLPPKGCGIMSKLTEQRRGRRSIWGQVIVSDEAPTRKVRQPAPPFIEDPLGMRELGKQRLSARKLHYERHRDSHEGFWEARPPREPSDAIDEGLIYASRAELIHSQSVNPIAARTWEFARWLTQEGDRRPGPDANLEHAVELFLAIEVVAAIRKKRGQPDRAPRIAEIQAVLLLLFEKEDTETNIKKRLQRHRSRFEAFRRYWRASVDQRRQSII